MTDVQFPVELADNSSYSINDKGAGETPAALRVTYGIIGALSILCNSLLSIVIVRTPRRLLNSYNILVLTLAITDTVTGFIVIASPSFVIGNSLMPIPPGIIGEIFCRFIQRNFFVWALANFSVAIVMSMAIERWYAITQPLKYQFIFTKRNTVKYVTLLLIFSTTVNTPQLFETHLETNDSQVICTNNLLAGSKTASQVYTVMYCMIAAFIPFIVIATTYLHLRYVVAQQQRLPQTHAQIHRRQQEMSLLRMTVFVGLSLGVCFIPDKITYLLLWFDVVNWDILMGTAVLCMLNSIINPWIYCLTNKHYRKQFARLLWPCCKRSSVADSSQVRSDVIGQHISNYSNYELKVSSFSREPINGQHSKV